MHLVSRQTSFVLGALVGLAISYVGQPMWKLSVMHFNQSKFGDMTFDCDNSMRTHLLAKQKLVGTPSEENANALQAAEIGLLDCQDYDIMRKRLVRWGLTENDLSEMSLNAIEEKGQDLRDVIRIHEIRY